MLTDQSFFPAEVMRNSPKIAEQCEMQLKQTKRIFSWMVERGTSTWLEQAVMCVLSTSLPSSLPRRDIQDSISSHRFLGHHDRVVCLSQDGSDFGSVSIGSIRINRRLILNLRVCSLTNKCVASSKTKISSVIPTCSSNQMQNNRR